MADAEMRASDDAGEDAAASHTLDDLPSLHVGMVVEGIVASVDDERALIDVRGKSEGLLAPREAVLAHGQRLSEALHPEDRVMVTILGFGPEDGAPILSQRRAQETIAWHQLEEAYQSGAVLEAPVFEQVRGGLLVDVGVRAFMPASQVERNYVPDLSAYVGKTVRVRVTEFDRPKGRVILSQRVVLEEEHQKRRERTWSELQEGQTCAGVVKGITSFGAFVDLGGVDGLLHVSAMSWGHVNEPSEQLYVGQELTVKILRLDRERNRISLGLKQLEPDPWEGVEERFPLGSVVDGRVARITAFGAFITLAPQIEGLAHISQLSDHRVEDPREVVAVGQEVQVKILRVSRTERRIGLSLRQAAPSAERPAPASPAIGDTSSGGVTIGDAIGDLLQRRGDGGAGGISEDR